MRVIASAAARVVVLPLALTLTALAAGAQAPTTPAEDVSAKTWVGRAAEFEDYLRTAEVARIEEMSVGVTRPRRVHLAPGGPFESLAWKPIVPGRYRGYFESYKSEIAAYEIDKLLGLNMVPPTVERRIKHELGAAIMWCDRTKSFKDLGNSGVPVAPPAHQVSWNRQVAQAMMFDNLIGDIDRNLGNWLVDPAWDLILIDHSRALTETSREPHVLTVIDGALWAKMQSLTQDALTAAVGRWVSRGSIAAVLRRRDKMQRDVEELIEKKGEAAVVIK